jgi:hypothetical protein
LEIIDIHASVTIVEEASFEGCIELELCFIPRDSKLVALGARAFAKYTSLRSFSVPPLVGEIGRNCLEDALDEFGLSVGSTLFRINIEDGGMELKFPGWTCVCAGEGNSELSLIQDIQ